ncbi:DUF1430 domain-containing protein, partial [Streptococcus suis]
FKREIAIKRIAGMGLAMFMTQSGIVSLGVVVALLINSWMLLNNHAKREEKIQLRVLNGRSFLRCS